MKHILKCAECSEYTMKDACSCGKKTENPKPPKYSPDDRMAGYRRKAKREILEKEGLL